MNGALSAESPLIAAFREFYREVVRLKGVVMADVPAALVPAGASGASGASGAMGPLGTAEPAARPEARANAVRQELTALLERQAAAASRGGGYGAEIYREAQYLMAALGDEVFLNLDWPGREIWKSQLLEQKLFGTHRAGEAVFERLDAILTSRDPIYLDLAKVYLFALGLGFAGRYRGPEGAVRLATYRLDLFNFLANREPELKTGPAHLFPEAYASTLDEGEPTHLPRLRFWIGVFAVVILAWFAASYQIWHSLLANLDPLVQQILAGDW